MAKPRYTSAKLWEGVRDLHRRRARFLSVVKGKRYEIAGLDEATREYSVKFETGRTRSVPLSDLHAIYDELYRIGRMPRNHLRKPENGRRIVGHTRYSHAPGATIYAILPVLDDQIHVEKGGHLKVV